MDKNQDQKGDMTVEQIEQLLDINHRITYLEGKYKAEIAGLKAERDRLKNEVDFLRNLIKISTVAKKVEKPGGGYQPIDDEDLEAAYQQDVKAAASPPEEE